MFYRKCRKCGHPMDPGDGYGNVCDDCILLEAQKKNAEMERQETVRIYVSSGSGCPKKKKRNAAYRLEIGSRENQRTLEGSVELDATANRAELLALSAALAHFHRACRIVIHTKSTYIANAFNGKWVNRWAQSGWRNAKGKPVANREEWIGVLKSLKGMAFQVVLEKDAENVE